MSAGRGRVGGGGCAAAPVPLELYGEWGMHDIDAGVLVDMPSFTVGLRLPQLPALPTAAFVFDVAAILRSRGAENLFWPDHEGRAAALELGGDAHIGSRASAAFRIFVEGVEDWTQVKGRLVGRFWL